MLFTNAQIWFQFQFLKKVTLIVNYSFYFCSNLASIKIPKSVSSIVQFAFCNCSIFTTISIPSKVTRNWRNLALIQILIDLYYINCFAFNLILAQSFSIRKKVTQISEYFFDTFFFFIEIDSNYLNLISCNFRY